jgi:bifunctional non-homologous end joining protein LigD
MSALAKTSLFFTDAGSDKEYHAEIVAANDGFLVNFRYGRRGSSLTSGSRTPVPVSFEQAEKVYLKLVKEKTSKGYTPSESGTTYQGTELAGLKSDFVPQLLNAIDEQELDRLIRDDTWVAQEKMDGERRAVDSTKGVVTGMNRKGLVVPLPQPIVDEILSLGSDLRIDNEIIGDVLYSFDIHVSNGKNVRNVGWLDRMELVQKTLANCKFIKAVPVAIGTEAKRALVAKVKSSKGEGVVFKRIDALVKEGRPNSGGTWLKFKFTERSTVQVTSISATKRSVAVHVFDENGNQVNVGNVTILPNFEIPNVSDLVDVEYLYAYLGGSLFQPIYRGKRTDLDVSACKISQLKYKPEGRDDEKNSAA